MARSEKSRIKRNRVNSLKQKLKKLKEKIIICKLKKLEKKLKQRENTVSEQGGDILEISVSTVDETFD